MKQLLMILCIAFYGQAQLTTNWERCSRTTTKPSWFGSGTERGLAYGNMGSGNRLYIVSRNGGSSIKVIDAASGTDITPGTAFDLTLVTGGTFAISDIEMTTDNVLIAANMASSAFKLYVWTSEGGAPTVHSFTLPVVSGIRYGDKFTVVGSWTGGTVEVYVPGAGTSAAGKIQVLKTTNQGTNWTTSEIALSGSYLNTVASEHIAVFGVGGNFYLGGNGHNPRQHDNTGAYVASSLFSGVNSSQASSKAITVSGNKMLVTVQYRAEGVSSDPKVTRGQIYNVSNAASVQTYAVTPYLADSAVGTVANAVNGDVTISDNGNGSMTVYILGTDQGIGAYTTTNPLPVELISLNAAAGKQSVTLTWKTATEVNNHGFEIEKNINGSWKNIGFVEGNGTTNAPQSYTFIDASAKGTVSYRLKQIDRDGKFEYTKSVDATVAEILTFGLDQNYPNPFNPNTVISYQLPLTSPVRLSVYDAIGREVATVVNEVQEAGNYTAQFDGSKLSSGIYFYTLHAGQFTATKKLLLMK
ncbi:MAG: T9SS type A sorting domain-containing protein [Bacteroidota bacterium]